MYLMIKINIFAFLIKFIFRWTMKNFKMLFFNMEIMIIIFIKRIYKDRIVVNPQHKHNRILIIESLTHPMLIHQEINGEFFK
jgi:hypothetical protein